MIYDAEQNGLLKIGGTIVEPTSGNTGVALAMVSILRGYKMIYIMADKMSKEKEWLILAFGSTVIRTRRNVSPKSPESYYSIAEKIVAETSNAYSPKQ